MTPDNRPRLNIRPQQMLAVQQQNQMGMNQQRIVMNPQGNFVQGEVIQPSNDPNMLMAQRMVPAGQNVILQGQQMNPQQQAQQQPAVESQIPTTVNQGGPQDIEGIPDSVTAELEKLEQEDNGGMDEVGGVGDLLGGLGDDDDDLLNSLTAEMGDDFNILEYADPELDTTDDEKTTLLDSLEMDESESAKEEKLKQLEAEKLAKANMAVRQGQVVDPNLQQQLQNRMIGMSGNQLQPNVNLPDISNMNPQGAPQGQVMGQVPNQQQIILNQQGMNFQQKQVRIKTFPSPEIQQIHQQMMLQVRLKHLCD